MNRKVQYADKTFKFKNICRHVCVYACVWKRREVSYTHFLKFCLLLLIEFIPRSNCQMLC